VDNALDEERTDPSVVEKNLKKVKVFYILLYYGEKALTRRE